MCKMYILNKETDLWHINWLRRVKCTLYLVFLFSMEKIYISQISKNDLKGFPCKSILSLYTLPVHDCFHTLYICVYLTHSCMNCCIISYQHSKPTLSRHTFEGKWRLADGTFKGSGVIVDMCMTLEIVHSSKLLVWKKKG